jgi:uncharacterized membrane protein YcaP (DUF421 family)
MAKLREHGLDRLDQVNAAFMEEEDGEVSVIETGG